MPDGVGFDIDAEEVTRVVSSAIEVGKYVKRNIRRNERSLEFLVSRSPI